MDRICPRCESFYNSSRQRLSHRDGQTFICTDCCTNETLELLSDDLTAETLLWWGYDPRQKVQKQAHISVGKPMPTVRNAGKKPKEKPKLW